MDPVLSLQVRCLTDDHFNYSRLFVENAYSIKRQSSPFVVVDVNAGAGYFTHVAALCGASKIYALEPNVENFYQLCSNTSLLGKSIVQCPYGLSNIGTVLPLYGPDKINNFKLYSSIRIDPNEPEEKPFSYGVFLSPKQFCEHVLESEPKIDLLKVYLSSYEDVLSIELLNKTENICIEILNIQASDIENIKLKLAGNGFKDVIVKNTNYDVETATRSPDAKFNFILVASKTSCNQFFEIEEKK